MNKPEPIIRIENYGRTSRVFFAGIDISTGIKGISFLQNGESLRNPVIEPEIEVVRLFEKIADESDEQIKNAAAIINNYIEIYRSSKKEELIETAEIAAIEATRTAIYEPNVENMEKALNKIKDAQEEITRLRGDNQVPDEKRGR